MEYKVTVNTFDKEIYSGLIEKIKIEKNNSEKEKYFTEIAKDILEKESFSSIKQGASIHDFKGVPFDLMAIKNNRLSLIELKGSMSSFNFSSPVQFSRLNLVIKGLANHKKKIKCNPYLLQINLTYGIYQIFGEDFYEQIFTQISRDGEVKTKTENIQLIVDDIVNKMDSMKSR